MKRICLLLLCVAVVGFGQDESGRDSGKQPGSVLFVSWQRTDETGAIWHSAWRALERHDSVSRNRLVSFDGNEERGLAYLRAHKRAALVVAFDGRAAELVRRAAPDCQVLLVDHTPNAHLVTRADREILVRLMRHLRPDLKRVAVFGAPPETLPGTGTKPCGKAADAAGCGLAWLREGTDADLPGLRKELDALGIPLVVTAGAPPLGHATMTVRPHPDGLGLRLADLVLANIRDGQPLRRVAVKRHRVVVDLGAAARAGYRVPLGMLARADAVRRQS